MRKRMISILMCITLAGALMTGCQMGDSNTAGKGSSTTEQASSGTAQTVAQGEVFSATPEQLALLPEDMIGTKDQFKGMKIGFSQRNIAGSEWWEQLVRLAKEEAEYLGIELTVYDGGNDLTKQMADIETLVNLKPDAIIVNPFHSTGVLPSIEKVHEAGIPLTVVNCALDAEGSPFTFVSCDVENSGFQSGYQLAKAYDEKYGWKDQVKALVLSAAAQEEESDLRRWGQIAGYNDYMLEKYGKSNLDIVAYRYYNWQPEPAMNETLDALQANADLDIIFAACDGGAQGVVAALDSVGKSGDIMITSIDARKTVLEWIDSGDKGVVATVANDPRMMGKWAVYLAALQANGITTPSTFYVPNTCYTKANVASVYDPNSTY
ncbi:MAG TPA: sugar ABC transporter substrate-binding protein [Clostridiales bacterium]|nr:sugar ABC transporter substrate-binding protein [Clostridiales bacterium]